MRTRQNHPPVFLKAGGFCYAVGMNRIALRFALSLALALVPALVLVGTLGVGPARADYKGALQMVRAGDYEKAMAEFLTLAEGGHPQSQFSLGLMHHLGRGVKPDLKTAYAWYKKSALQEHPPSINNIGMMYLNGEYVAQNREIAFKLFEMASAEHAQAKDNLGQCFENGWGVERDIEQAINFYQLAGEEGYVLGYYHLGRLFEKGYPDTPKDIDKAVEWYIKAAEKDVAKARARLIRLKRLPDSLKK